MAESMFTNRAMCNKDLVKHIQAAIEYIEGYVDPADDQPPLDVRKMLQALYQSAWMISQLPPNGRAK